MPKRLRHDDGARAPRGHAAASTLLLIAVLSLGACSWVPNWANPVEWYDSAFGDSAPPPPSAAPPAQASAEEGFPKLSTVPERPAAPSTAEQRAALAEGLVADKERARYTDETLRGSPPDTPSLSAPPSASAPMAEESMAPPPMTSPAPTPVTSASVPQPSIVAAPTPPPSPVPYAPPTAAPAGGMPSPSIVAAPAPAPYPPLSPTQSAGSSGFVPPPSPQSAPSPTLPYTPPPSTTAAPPPMPTAQLPPGVRPAAGTDQQTLVQAFAGHLAESGATVVTTPTHGAFNASSSPPLAPQSVPVPEVVRQNYNDSLTRAPATMSQASAMPAPSMTSAPMRADGAVASVKFANGSAALSADARKTIKRLADEFKARGGTILVVGHASHRTRDVPIMRHNLINFRLSADRAKAVADDLIRHGVRSDAILIEARGDNDPIYYEWMPEGEAENRRVDIYFGS